METLPHDDPEKINFRYTSSESSKVKGSFQPTGGSSAPRESNVEVTFATKPTECEKDYEEYLTPTLEGVLDWDISAAQLGDRIASRMDPNYQRRLQDGSFAGTIATRYPEIRTKTKSFVKTLDPATIIFNGSVEKGCKANIMDSGFGTAETGGLWVVDCDVEVKVTADCS